MDMYYDQALTARAWIVRKEVEMNQPNFQPVKPESSLPNDPAQPASWGGAFLALGPFLLLPVIFLLGMLLAPLQNALNIPDLGLAFSLALFAMLLAALLVSWVQAFPRWSFPYWGYVLLISFYFQGFTGTVFGYAFTGSWRVWLPLIGVAALGLLWKRDLASPYRLLTLLWKDPTLLSFTFYGALPLLFIVAYEEVRGEEPVLAVLTLLLGAGALLYMRSPKIWPRFAALLAGFSLAWVAATIHLGLYWNGRQEPWMPEPATWAETLAWTSRMGVLLALILLAPLTIAALHWLTRSLRPPKTA